MARKLSAKQIALLKSYPQFFTVDDLPKDEQGRLEKMNDCETVWQDADRFLQDQYSAEQNKRDWLR